MSMLLLIIKWECMFTSLMTIYIYLLLVYFSLNVFQMISFCILQKQSCRTGTKWGRLNDDSFWFSLNTALSETWWWRAEQSSFGASLAPGYFSWIYRWLEKRLANTCTEDKHAFETYFIKYRHRNYNFALWQGYCSITYTLHILLSYLLIFWICFYFDVFSCHLYVIFWFCAFVIFIKLLF